MLKRLPDFVEPLRYADEGRTLEGEVSVETMDRLQEALSRPQAVVTCTLKFGVDALQNRYLQGELTTNLWMTCQRCLQDMQVPIQTQFALGLVRSDGEADDLPDHYEPLLVGSKPVKLTSILEDELILALPIVALHPQATCQSQNSGEDINQEETASSEANPFAVLKKLNPNKS